VWHRFSCNTLGVRAVTPKRLALSKATIPGIRDNGVPFGGMKRLLPLLALTSVIWGRQNGSLVGLPEYGVILMGTVEEPSIVNGSGRIIIGHVLHFEHEGGSSYWRELKTRGLRLDMKNLSAGIPPGGRESPLSADGPAPIRVHPAVSKTFSKVSLDVVVFANGEVVGPDSGNYFADMANQVIAEQEFAQRVSVARYDPTKREAIWAEVNRLIQRSNGPQPEAERLQTSLARDLDFAKNRSGETAAYDVADRQKTIPKLWRAK
jgi:hypothetical protein